MPRRRRGRCGSRWRTKMERTTRPCRRRCGMTSRASGWHRRRTWPSCRSLREPFRPRRPLPPERKTPRTTPRPLQEAWRSPRRPVASPSLRAGSGWRLRPSREALPRGACGRARPPRSPSRRRRTRRASTVSPPALGAEAASPRDSAEMVAALRLDSPRARDSAALGTAAVAVALLRVASPRRLKSRRRRWARRKTGTPASPRLP
mmetsp:Transcript_15469/g.58832  ORF Transcript_15469/g.58832 Transcript_15469/m.58832 type:complete len:205 (+) Transcript_15469:808-1422(+)